MGADRWPNVKSVNEKDVVAALTHLRDLLQGDVGVAAQVLKALVGAVILETRQVDGQAKPQMVARFTINAVSALAVLERHWSAASNDAPKEMWAAVDHVTQPAETKQAKAGAKGDTIVSLAYDRKAAARKTARNRDGAT